MTVQDGIFADTEFDLKLHFSLNIEQHLNSERILSMGVTTIS